MTPHPRQEGKVMRDLDVAHAAGATSGDHERYFECASRR